MEDKEAKEKFRKVLGALKILVLAGMYVGGWIIGHRYGNHACILWLQQLPGVKWIFELWSEVWGVASAIGVTVHVIIGFISKKIQKIPLPIAIVVVIITLPGLFLTGCIMKQKEVARENVETFQIACGNNSEVKNTIIINTIVSCGDVIFYEDTPDIPLDISDIEKDGICYIKKIVYKKGTWWDSIKNLPAILSDRLIYNREYHNKIQIKIRIPIKETETVETETEKKEGVTFVDPLLVYEDKVWYWTEKNLEGETWEIEDGRKNFWIDENSMGIYDDDKLFCLNEEMIKELMVCVARSENECPMKKAKVKIELENIDGVVRKNSKYAGTLSVSFEKPLYVKVGTDMVFQCFINGDSRGFYSAICSDGEVLMLL